MSNTQALDTYEYRHAVLALAKTRADELTSRVLDAVFSLPGYTTDARSSDLDDLGAGARYTASQVLDALFLDRSLSPDEVLAFKVLGARRTHLPREVLTAGIGAAREAGLDFLLDIAQEVPAPGAVAVATIQWFRSQLCRLTADIADAMLAGHANEQARRPRTGSQERMWLVDRVIHGLFENSDGVAADARRLGCELSPPVGLCLVVPFGEARLDGLEGLRAVSTRLAEKLPRAIEGPARPMPSGLHAVLLVSRLTDVQVEVAERLDDEAKSASVHLVCAEPAESIDELRGAYRRTTRDISLPAYLRLPPGVVTADDLAFCRIVSRATPEETADFVDRFLGPVLESRGAAQLVETLEALYHCPGIPEAAATLGVHDNTVYSRIRRVTQLTGCDLDVPRESQRIYLSLRLRSVLDSV